MPLLTITADCTGSPDGIAIQAYKAGDTLDITPHLAPALIAAGWAVPADEAKAPEAKAPIAPIPAQETAPVNTAPIETKAAPAAPENKAVKPATQTKAPKGKK